MPDETVWPLHPHTLGKHLVLRGYLDAWLPIMASWNGRILFIDGFAGPGEYSAGEPGSPVIALNALIEHSADQLMKGEIGFIFIEADGGRVDRLRRTIEPLKSSLPSNAWINIHHSAFDQTMGSVLDKVDAQAARLAPAFVMVDPFGVSGTPMSVIQRIMQNDRSEVYISFQYEAINRFATTPEFEHHLDDLFGTDEWKDALELKEFEERKDFYYSLYESQLRDAGAKHVLKFELYEGNRLVYAIFFGTQHEVGSDRMKRAIWEVAPWGDFKFRPIAEGQLTLGIETPDLRPLMQQIATQFKGKGWVTIEEIERYVKSDKTVFHKGQLKRGALVPMEVDERIEVDESTRNRRRTYPPETKIRIA